MQLVATWAGKELRKSIICRPGSWLLWVAWRITRCRDLWDSFSSALSQTSTFPSAVTDRSSSTVSPSRDDIARIRSYTWGWWCVLLVIPSFSNFSPRQINDTKTDSIMHNRSRIKVLKVTLSWKRTVFMLSKTLRRWAWMVWESEAWPRISSRAASETKKNRGNSSRFFSK